MAEKRVILALSAHTDDVELGCGATLARYQDAECEVHCATFSRAPSRGRHDPGKELYRAATCLGISRSHVHLYDYPRRHFHDHRQKILQRLCDLEKRLHPHIIFCPSRTDTHQDHEVISRETFRAFKHYTILGYELPWNTIAFNSQAFVHLQEKHLQKKIRAVACYRSQSGRPFMDADFLSSWARMRGGTIAQPYAEAFEVIRLTIVPGRLSFP